VETPIIDIIVQHMGVNLRTTIKGRVQAVNMSQIAAMLTKVIVASTDDAGPIPRKRPRVADEV
jgi:hypothetical protein